MLPPKGREVLEECRIGWLAFADEFVECLAEVDGVPVADGGGDRVESGGAVSLVFEIEVADSGCSYRFKT